MSLQTSHPRAAAVPRALASPALAAALAQLAQTVEESIRATGAAEVPSEEVGLAILGPLRDLDEVAYLRFASVYRSFSSIDDFEKAIGELRSADAPRPPGPTG